MRLKTCFGRFSGLSSAQPATTSRPAAVALARIEAHTGIRLVERMGRNPFRDDPCPSVPDARGAAIGRPARAAPVGTRPGV